MTSVPPPTAAPRNPRARARTLPLPGRLRRGGLRARALHRSAAIAWYEGQFDLARERWETLLAESRAERGEWWVRALFNLGFLLERQGAPFEAFVLLGLGERRAESLSGGRFEGFGELRRGHLALAFGDHDRARASFESAARKAERRPLAEARRTVLTGCHAGLSDLAALEGDHARAVAEAEAGLALLGDLTHVRRSSRASAELRLLRQRFLLDRRERPALLMRMARLPRTYSLDGDWRTLVRAEVAALRLRGLVEGDAPTPVLRRAAHRVLDSHGDLRRAGAADHVLFAAEVLLERAGDAVAARRAYDRVGNHQLRRIVAVHRGSRDLPELAEVDATDLGVLRGFRRRLESRHAELLEAFTHLWRRGEPAHDLLVGNDETLALCAWCRRLRARDGHWLPLDFDLPEARQQVSHGLCTRCSEGLES